MLEQKRYHQRKLAIIEMIEECDRCIDKEKDFMERNAHYHELRYLETSYKNIQRYESIRLHLTERYNRQ